MFWGAATAAGPGANEEYLTTMSKESNKFLREKGVKNGAWHQGDLEVIIL
jgi:hypothetical protein